MRHFIAVVAFTAVVGVIAAERTPAVQARATVADVTLDRLSDIASWPLRMVIPDPPAPPMPPTRIRQEDFRAVLSAPRALVVDQRTDTVLYAKNPDTSQSLASLTKLMTALLATDLILDWNATTTITASHIREGNQTLAPGNIYSAEDLFAASLVGSINTAMIAFVEMTGLTESEFVEEMNVRARQLGLASMHFVDATGLSGKNVGSARDVARLLKISLSHPRIKVASVRDRAMIRELKSGEIKLVKATDWLLTNIVPLSVAHVEGGKTGYIAEAGFNFAVQLQNDAGNEIRVVVLGATDVYKRFTETAALAAWTYETYEWK